MFTDSSQELYGTLMDCLVRMEDSDFHRIIIFILQFLSFFFFFFYVYFPAPHFGRLTARYLLPMAPRICFVDQWSAVSHRVSVAQYVDDW
jgi:hypothetical protein